MKTTIVLAVDPGRGKCGIAMASPDGDVIAHEVVNRADLPQWLVKAEEKFEPSLIIIGNRTACNEIQQTLQSQWPDVSIRFVEEAGSSQEARARWVETHRPIGLRRLIPRGLRTPTVPYDDLAAVILIERYFGGKSE